jgi:hypothetical protein
MSVQLRLLAALHQAEALADSGARVDYCLEHVATAHSIDRGTLAALWIEKRIEVELARDAVARLEAGDADAEAGGR